MTKKALQLTMHRVKNYGSVLQAYALNRYIDSLPGWECEVIDLMPNVPGLGVKAKPICSVAWEAARLFATFVRRPSVRALRSTLAPFRRWYEDRFLYPVYTRIFDRFLADEIRKTGRYESEVDLFKSPPVADVYITGSDQTFNPRFTKGAPVWFLEFVHPKGNVPIRKISYASSIAAANLSEEMREVYTHGLTNFDALSFRERSGVSVAEGLGFAAEHCCDPTLLLTREEWMRFAAKATVDVGKKYILVYNLRYMVDPYPLSAEIEHRIQQELGLKIVYLNGPLVTRPCKNSIHIWKATPHDFVKLFLEASFIITDSFHGTAFSLISGNPFISFVHGDSTSDSRVADLLATCKAQGHAIVVGGESGVKAIQPQGFIALAEEQNGLCGFRERSRQWIRTRLSIGLS